MSKITNYYMDLETDAQEMSLYDFLTKHGNTMENRIMWLEINDVKE